MAEAGNETRPILFRRLAKRVARPNPGAVRSLGPRAVRNGLPPMEGPRLLDVLLVGVAAARPRRLDGLGVWTRNVPPLPLPLPPDAGAPRRGAALMMWRTMRRALVRFDTAGPRGAWRVGRACSAPNSCGDRRRGGWSFPDWAASANDLQGGVPARAGRGAAGGCPWESELPRQKWVVYNQHPSETRSSSCWRGTRHEMTVSSHPGMKFTWCLLPTGLQI